MQQADPSSGAITTIHSVMPLPTDLNGTEDCFLKAVLPESAESHSPSQHPR